MNAEELSLDKKLKKKSTSKSNNTNNKSNRANQRPGTKERMDEKKPVVFPLEMRTEL